MQMVPEMNVVMAATTVRDAADPYLLALNLTKGQLVFASEAAEELATGTPIQGWLKKGLKTFCVNSFFNF